MVQKETNEPLPRGSEKILVVEDDPGMRDVIETVLSRLGYFVVTVRNGREAWEKIAHDPSYKLVISDVVMSELSGVELFRRIKKSFPNNRVLLTSAYSKPEEMEALKSEGLSGFLAKPFPSSALAKEVRRILDSERS